MNGIYNFLQLNESLSSSGMPTAEQMKEVADAGVNVVINLALKTSPKALANEEQVVNSLGMEYIHIPVEWERPTRQNLEDFFAAMEAHKNQKVHVHCQANYRATAFITLYRILREGWKPDDAIPMMEAIWNPEDFPIWQRFIEENLSLP